MIDIEKVIDLYYYEDAPIGFESGGAGAYCYAGAPSAQPLAGTDAAGWVDRLAGFIASRHPADEDFRVEFDGMAFRACRCRDRDGGNTQISLRRLPSQTPRLDDLTITPSGVTKLLMSPALNDGGLILFSGLTGQGKSTLASATIRSRMEKFGGRGVSVEDVLEVPLEGVWASGSFRQIRVDYDASDSRSAGFAGAVRRAYRSLPATRPAMLYIGEVRDTETATEVVKAAANGMIVVTTIHAGSPVMAVMRLIGLAEADMGEVAAMSVAQSLRVVAQSSLVLRPDVTGWKRGTFDVQVLASDGPASPVGAQVARRQYAQMTGLQEGQQAALARIGALPTRSGAALLTELCHGGR